MKVEIIADSLRAGRHTIGVVWDEDGRLMFRPGTRPLDRKVMEALLTDRMATADGRLIRASDDLEAWLAALPLNLRGIAMKAKVVPD